jgi:hypothetical protein
MGTVKGEEWGAHAEGFGGKTVYEISGSGKGVRPVVGRHGGMKQQSVGDIIYGAEHTLDFAVLLGGVWTRHSERDTFGKKESTRGGIVEFTAIVTLHGFVVQLNFVSTQEKKYKRVGKVSDFNRMGKVQMK